MFNVSSLYINRKHLQAPPWPAFPGLPRHALNSVKPAIKNALVPASARQAEARPPALLRCIGSRKTAGDAGNSLSRSHSPAYPGRAKCSWCLKWSKDNPSKRVSSDPALTDPRVKLSCHKLWAFSLGPRGTKAKDIRTSLKHSEG